MITVDLTSAIALYLSLLICLVLILWTFYTWKEKRAGGNKTADLQQCPYCTYIFFKLTKESFKICPRCKSYIDPHEEVRPASDA